MKDNEIIRLKELIEKFKKEKRLEEELFDKAKDIKDKELHLSNIRKLDVKLNQLSVKLNGTYIEEDTIKAPFEYIASAEEYGVFFRNSREEEY